MICNICSEKTNRLVQIREETEGSPTIAVFSRWICIECFIGIAFEFIFPKTDIEKSEKPKKLKKEEKENVT